MRCISGATVSIWLVGICALLLAPSAPAGGLRWDQTSIEVDAAKGQSKVEVEYGFTNTSDTSVEIQKVQTSCGCTTADLTKKVYQPGEAGRLKVVFAVENRKGRQKKTIAVKTNQTQPPDALTLVVNIPDAIKFNTQSLSWKKGGGKDSQSFLITADEGSEVVGVRAVGKSFEATLLPRDDGEAYRVQIVPKSTDAVVREKICIEVADPSKRYLYKLVSVEE